MTVEVMNQNKGLLTAFRSYKKSYFNVGKKPDLIKLLPEALYRTMRLEGEKIIRKQAQSLFQ